MIHLYMNELKMRVRYEDELENEIKTCEINWQSI